MNAALGAAKVFSGRASDPHPGLNAAELIRFRKLKIRNSSGWVPLTPLDIPTTISQEPPYIYCGAAGSGMSRGLMQDGRLPVRARLGLLAGGAVALALSGSACGGRSFESAVKDHLRNAPPDTTSVPNLGRVKSVQCFLTDLAYQGAPVYSCDVTYSSGALTDICAAKIDGEIVTQRDDRALPCIAHSQPAP